MGLDSFDLLTVAEMQEPWRSRVRKGEITLEEVPLTIKLIAMHKASKVYHDDHSESTAVIV